MSDSEYTGWMYRGRCPPSNSAYLENMARCIFQSGLSWKMIKDKWPAFREAFHDFDIETVAGYGSDDIARLLSNPKIVRNRRKILATIHNAREFESIIREYSSVSKWLDSMDKSNNYNGIVSKILSRFKHLGPTTAHLWLYSVGEDIKFHGY